MSRDFASTMKKSSWEVGSYQPELNLLHKCVLQRKLNMIRGDDSHPLNGSLVNNIMAKGSGRLYIPILNINGYFYPTCNKE